jgi:hypothetical protein
MQYLQDRKLGQAQSLLHQMRSDGPLERLERASQRHDQLQRRGSVGLMGGVNLLFSSWRRHYI